MKCNRCIRDLGFCSFKECKENLNEHNSVYCWIEIVPYDNDIGMVYHHFCSIECFLEWASPYYAKVVE